MSPEILLLDEPYAGLDPQGRGQLATLLSGLPQTRIVVGHDLAWLRTVCDRTILLADGRVMADHPDERIQASPCPLCGSQ
ncbi:MAG: hypothetical protein HQL99_12880 [Magnetococcales bacterium]|nr:hypothetical protein [Magnetococcales bacterium]